MLSKREWKARRPFQRSGGASLRGMGVELASVASGETVGSTVCTTDMLETSFKSSFEDIYPVPESDEEQNPGVVPVVEKGDHYFI